MRTLIAGGHVVAWSAGSHRLLTNGMVVLEDDRVAFVGREYPGAVDRRIDARGRLVMPGFVNLHCHAEVEAGGRLVADAGRPDVFHAGFLNYYVARPGTASMFAREDRRIGATLTFVELLKSGCTTAVEIGAADETVVEVAGRLGIRAYLTPGFKSATYRGHPDGTIFYEWDEAAGRAGLDRATRFIREHDGAFDGRIKGMLFPIQVDTCSPDLLRATRKAADALGVGIEIHCGQNLFEFHEILRRHRRTPVEHLAALGLLGPDTILGHCIITTAHRLAGLPGGRDLEILAERRATVAHCPLVFARRGNALESFHGYRRAGINVGLGTDTYPRDMIAEMRWASLLGKVVEHDFLTATAADVFTAATVAGARALGREDLGRLAPGAKADVVLVDLGKLRIGPYRDPIRALVNCATTDDVERVFVDGRLVVDGGRVIGIDEPALLAQAQAEAERLWASWPEWHPEGRTADDVSPPSFSRLAEDLVG